MDRKTVVLGASPNPSRYSHIAATMLKEHSENFVLYGLKEGTVAGSKIETRVPDKLDNVDTFTLYVGAKNQPTYYPFVLNSKPKRIIFNPGAENSELASMAILQGIEVVEACTLVMLRTGQF